MATLDWVDVLYRAYLTALLVAGALVRDGPPERDEILQFLG